MSRILMPLKPGGMGLRVGRLSPAEEIEFFQRFGNGPIAYFRGAAPYLRPIPKARPVSKPKSLRRS
jgi:hypothetical protein